MKTNLLLASLILATAVFSDNIFAQDTKYWGSWQSASCHSKIQYRVRRRPDVDPSEKYGYIWYIQFKNNSSKRVAFGFTLKGSHAENVEYMKQYGSSGRIGVDANSTSDGLDWSFAQNPDRVFVTIGYLQSVEAGQANASTPFEGCDNTHTLIDDLCYYKPVFSCPNYAHSKREPEWAANPKPRSSSDPIPPSQGPNSVNDTFKPHYSKDLCGSLLITYQRGKDSPDPKIRGNALRVGKEFINGCESESSNLPKAEKDRLKQDLGSLSLSSDKVAVAPVIQEQPNRSIRDSVSTPASSKTTGIGGAGADDLKRSIFENIKNALASGTFDHTGIGGSFSRDDFQNVQASYDAEKITVSYKYKGSWNDPTDPNFTRYGHEIGYDYRATIPFKSLAREVSTIDIPKHIERNIKGNQWVDQQLVALDTKYFSECTGTNVFKRGNVNFDTNAPIECSNLIYKMTLGSANLAELIDLSKQLLNAPRNSTLSTAVNPSRPAIKVPRNLGVPYPNPSGPMETEVNKLLAIADTATTCDQAAAYTKQLHYIVNNGGSVALALAKPHVEKANDAIGELARTLKTCGSAPPN